VGPHHREGAAGIPQPRGVTVADLPAITAVPTWPIGTTIYPVEVDSFTPPEDGAYAKNINDIIASIGAIQNAVGTSPAGISSSVGAALALLQVGLNALQTAQQSVESELATITQIPGPPNTWFQYTQGTPASSWTITHSMGRYPAVTIVDSAGSVVEGDIEFVSTSVLIITFSSPFAGDAYLS
jgi:hypothetical protein